MEQHANHKGTEQSIYDEFYKHNLLFPKQVSLGVTNIAENGQYFTVTINFEQILLENQKKVRIKFPLSALKTTLKMNTEDFCFIR